MVKRKSLLLYSLLICLICGLIIGSASAAPPAAGIPQDPSAEKEYVHHPAQAVLQSGKGRMAFASAAAVSGTRPLLVLLVETNDLAPAASHDRAFFEDLFFDTAPVSVADFYDEISYGAFTYTEAAVLDPGNDNAAPFWYTPAYSTAEIRDDVTKQKAMVRWAIQQADADFNFASYDTNSDKTVTNEELTIVVIVTGTGKEIGGTAAWAYHRFAGNVKTEGDTITVEGEYSIVSENSPAGTSAHELGHDLGLPDLYDTDDSNGDSEGIGHYGLMGSGNYCGPSHMTAWEKAKMGWLTPTVVPANAFYNIRDSETNAEAYILRASGHRSDEYFLVENRWRGTSYDSRTGREGMLPDQGIIIYHIDDAKGHNADETHKMVDVECSDFQTSHVADADDLDSLANRGDANDLWDDTEYDFTDTANPAKSIWYGGAASGIKVCSLPAPGATMRTFLAVSENTAPVASASAPATVKEGSAVQFDAAGSSDPNGDPLEYRWDFTSDGSWDTAWTDTPTASSTFCDEGTYSARVEVRDPCGLTAQATVQVTVENVPPSITPIADIPSLKEGTAFTVAGSFSDPGCDAWTGTVDYDDGAGPQLLTLTGKTFELGQSYCDNGEHHITVVINDGDGGSDTEEFTVTVVNVPPVAHAGDDQTVDEGIPVSFSGSVEDAGTCDTFTYSWNFGDGAPEVTGTLTPSHTYGDNGVYVVTLTVRDDDGGEGSDTLAVTVNNVAPVVTKGLMDQPNGQFILPVVHTLTFHGTFSDQGWLDTHTALWNFGDSTTDSGVLTEENLQPDATGTVSATHAYGAPGDYLVTVTVTDDDGGATTSAAWAVHVADVAEAKHDLAAYIQGLPADAFKGKADQRKGAFANKFVALDDMITRKEWKGFITSLVSDIRDKADGQVDGKPGDDWIVSKDPQQHVCMKIDDIVRYVKTFM